VRTAEMIKHIMPKAKLDRKTLRTVLEAIIMTDAEMIFGGKIDENKSILAEMTKMSDQKIEAMQRRLK